MNEGEARVESGYSPAKNYRLPGYGNTTLSGSPDRRKNAAAGKNLAGKRGVSFHAFSQFTCQYWKRSGARISAACCLLSLLALRIKQTRAAARRSASGHRFNTSGPHHHPLLIRRSQIISSLWNSATCWLWRFFSLSSAGGSDRHRGCAATNQLHLAAATLFLDTLGEFNINRVAQVAIEQGFYPARFSQLSTISAPRRWFFGVTFNFFY